MNAPKVGDQRRREIIGGPDDRFVRIVEVDTVTHVYPDGTIDIRRDVQVTTRPVVEELNVEIGFVQPDESDEPEEPADERMKNGDVAYLVETTYQRESHQVSKVGAACTVERVEHDGAVLVRFGPAWAAELEHDLMLVDPRGLRRTP